MTENTGFPFEKFFSSQGDDSKHGPILNNALRSAKEKGKKPFEIPRESKSILKENGEAPTGPSEEFFSSEELTLINAEIHSYLKKNISPQKYNAFFEGAIFIKAVELEKITFSATTPLIKAMVEKNTKTLDQAVVGVLGKSYQIEFIVDGIDSVLTNSTQNNGPKAKPKSAKDVSFTLDINPTKDELLSKVESQYIDHMNPLPTGMIIDPNKTFDNFIVGPSNNLAFAASMSIGKNPGRSGKYPSLYIHSSSGLGKTHLLHAVANGIKEKYPHYIICLITARDFMKEMINAIKDRRLHEFQKKYSESVDVLMIDDIHELKNKDGTQNEFFHVFNELYNKGKQLIFTSDKAPQEIDGIEERIKTRLQWGLVVDIQKPDLETRIAILKKKANELDLFLTYDIINLIATNIKTNIRELEGALIKLSAFAEVMKVDIDAEMVKESLMLHETIHERKIDLDHIAKATSQYYRIPVADLKSKARTKELSNARHVAMYLSRKIVNSTQEEIGRFYGGRDHSSVIHAERTVAKRLSTDRALSKDIVSIENAI